MALWLIEKLGVLPGLENLVLTTNGSQLDRFAKPLKSAGVKRINISLDTLKPERFTAITRIGELDKVIRGIEAAREAGFRRTKLNAGSSAEPGLDITLDFAGIGVDDRHPLGQRFDIVEPGRSRRCQVDGFADGVLELGRQGSLQTQHRHSGFTPLGGHFQAIGGMGVHQHAVAQAVIPGDPFLLEPELAVERLRRLVPSQH